MRIHGSHGQVKLDPTGAAAGTAVVSLNSWVLNMARDTVDVTAFDDTVKQYVAGLPDIKGTLGGWYDMPAMDPLFDVAEGSTPGMLTLIPSSLAPTYLWKGLAYLDASINVTATGAVSVSSNFVGAGPWTREPTT